MKSIPLTRGEFAIVDDEDYEYLNQWNWQCSRNGKCKYAVRRTRATGRAWMHRVIVNAPNKTEVDHINGNGLDNRRCNLRVCTHQENMRNRRLHKNNTTGFKGVSLHRKSLYQVKIRVNGKLLHIGVFSSAEVAARAYDEAAKKHFGKFAKLNFP